MLDRAGRTATAHSSAQQHTQKGSDEDTAMARVVAAGCSFRSSRLSLLRSHGRSRAAQEAAGAAGAQPTARRRHTDRSLTAAAGSRRRGDDSGGHHRSTKGHTQGGTREPQTRDTQTVTGGGRRAPSSTSGRSHHACLYYGCHQTDSSHPALSARALRRAHSACALPTSSTPQHHHWSSAEARGRDPHRGCKNGSRHRHAAHQRVTLLAHHAPSLKPLWCELTLTPSQAPLVWPASLTSLQLRLSSDPSTGEINRVLATLAALPSLQRLLFSSYTIVGVDVSLLGASPSLRDLSLATLYGGYPEFDDSQVATIRASLGHLQRISFGGLPATMARFLQPPVTARWQDIGRVYGADARTGDLLVTLPTLTKLDLDYRGDAPHADFLSRLPLLSALKLHCYDRVPASPLLASLLPCTGLTELDLWCAFSTSQVSALLAALTQLKTFKLNDKQLESLQCFASGPATLEDLFLYRFGHPLPPSQLLHLYALSGLRSLEFYSVFASLDDAALTSLTPPTVRLPRLTRFADASLRVEHQGPSFEWMQLRLTQ